MSKLKTTYNKNAEEEGFKDTEEDAVVKINGYTYGVKGMNLVIDVHMDGFDSNKQFQRHKTIYVDLSAREILKAAGWLIDDWRKIMEGIDDE